MKIKKLKIHSLQFEKQVRFYQEKMGLALLNKDDSSASFRIGATELTLEKNEAFKPYHFAINIPAHKEEEALHWLKERVDILKFGENEIQPFDNWNASAIYFYDEDQNIVEFISRRNLNHIQVEKFSPESLLAISEIGLPVQDIEALYHSLSLHVKIEKYDGSFERFCALGDEHGLFICINKQLKNWFPTDDKAHSSEFLISFEEKNRNYNLAFKAEQIQTQSSHR